MVLIFERVTELIGSVKVNLDWFVVWIEYFYSIILCKRRYTLDAMPLEKE